MIRPGWTPYGPSKAALEACSAIWAADLAEFGVTVELLPTGDAVEALNRAILTTHNPEGALLFGVDNVSFVRALEEDLFIEYESSALDDVDVIAVAAARWARRGCSGARVGGGCPTTATASPRQWLSGDDYCIRVARTIPLSP